MAPLYNPFIHDDGKKPTCMEMLQLIVDNQATDEQRTYFRQHMDNCLPCYKKYNVDMAVSELLKEKCSGENCPDDLVAQIKSKIKMMNA